MTTNAEGARAYALTPMMELYTLVVTMSLSDTFYEKAPERMRRLRQLIGVCPPEFTARLAVYAREKMYLRSVPLVMTVELARLYNGNGLISRLVERVVQRADEITELLAYYQLANERQGVKRLNKLSKQLQKGLAAAFDKFDEYQFAKYNRDAAIRLRDALFLVHPRPVDEARQALYGKIARNELVTPYTWEVELSRIGQEKFASAEAREEAFRAKWEELIFSGRLGYMALLRNLRNILQAEVSGAAIREVCRLLTDPVAVKNSKQLPFRFLSAYREIQSLNSGYVTRVMDALEDAVNYTASNIAGYDDETRVLIAADVSGSMQKPVSDRSKVLLFDIGLMLAMLLQHRCDRVVTGMFGDSWKVINMSKKNILAGVQEFYRREGEVGYSTNGYLVIRDLLNRNLRVDKVMIFTDCQLWNSRNTGENIESLWKQYKERMPGARLYLFDLAGLGNTPLQMPGNDVYLVSGWSDKIFEALRAIEQGGDALEQVNTIQL